MSRQEADGIVRKLVELYKPVMNTRPIGQPFDQVYDVVTVKPTAKWLETYEQVKTELRGMGLPLRP